MIRAPAGSGEPCRRMQARPPSPAALLTLTAAARPPRRRPGTGTGKEGHGRPTLRAYKADWTHFSQWCAAHGFIAIPAAPATVGAYLASLADSRAPATILRRLSTLGKMHRFNVPRVATPRLSMDLSQAL